MQDGLVTEVIITRLDRLTRSLATQIQALKVIENNNVRLIALDKNTDNTTASGKLHLNIISAIAQNEE